MADVHFVFVCAKCGHVHGSDYKQQWGISVGMGLGPTPVCNQLIDTPRGSQAVCRGDLIPQSTEG